MIDEQLTDEAKEAIKTSLKARALYLLGVYSYNEGGSDVPSKQVNFWYDAVIREFMSVFHWSWATLFAESPSDVLVLHWVRDGVSCYVPTSWTYIPDIKPDCQLAFCYMLASRVANVVTGDARSAQMMEMQAERYVSDARYKDAFEVCLRGDGAISQFYPKTERTMYELHSPIQ